MLKRYYFQNVWRKYTVEFEELLPKTMQNEKG
jgi:hypothetical protein